MSGLAVLGSEFRRTLRLARSYWLEYAADLLLYIVGFLLLILVFSAASDSYGPAGYLSSLIGFVTWKIGASVLADIARIAGDEARAGTLEQLYLSGQGLSRMFLLRAAGILLNHGLRGALLAGTLALILNLVQPLSLLALGLLALTLLGAAGLGFALAGLVLVYKRVEGFLQLLWQLLVFFTGALAPIGQPVLLAIARALPLTWGIEALRAVVVDNADLAALWGSGLLAGLLINTLVYMLLGAALFGWGQRQARLLGVLAHY